MTKQDYSEVIYKNRKNNNEPKVEIEFTCESCSYKLRGEANANVCGTCPLNTK